MTNSEAARLSVHVGASGIDRTERELAAFVRRLEAAAAASKKHLSEIDRSSTAHQRASQATNAAAREHQALINAQIRAARATEVTGGALRLIERELQQTAQGTRRYHDLVATQANVHRQAERAMGGHRAGLASLKTSLLDIAGGFGLASAAMGAFNAVAGKVAEGFNLAATLDQNRRALGTLMGDTARGNQVLQDAIKFGQQYGFTQRTMGAAAQSLATLLRGTSVETGKVLETVSRLQALNPSATFSDAARSIRELASGDYVSIADVFNLGKDAARGLRDEVAAGQDVFVALDAHLTKVGVSAEVLSNRMEGAAGAQHRAQLASENLALALGRIAQSHGAIEVLEGVTRAAEAVATFADFGFGEHQEIFTAAEGFDQYTAAIARANEQHKFYEAVLVALTPAQYAAAQALQATGVSAGDAFSRMDALKVLAYEMTPAFMNMAGASAETQAAIMAHADAALVLAATNEQVRYGVQTLLDATLAGTVSHQEFTAAIASMTAAQQVAAPATAATTDAVQTQTNALHAAADAAALDQVKSLELASAKQALEQQARLAADALLRSGNEGALAAAKLAASAAGVDQLTAAFYRLAQSQQISAAIGARTDMENAARGYPTAQDWARSQIQAGALAEQRAGERIAGAVTPRPGQTALAAEREAALAQGARQELARQAEVAARRGAGGTGGASAVENARTRAETAGMSQEQELAYWRKKLSTLKQGSTEYFNALAQVRDLEARIKSGRSGGGGGGAGALAGAQERAALAGQTTAGELDYWRKKLAGLKQGTAEYFDALAHVRELEARLKTEQTRTGEGASRDAEQAARQRQQEAEALRDAQRALMSDEERLASLRKELDAGGMPEVDRLRLVKEIRDLEGSIARQRQQAADTAARAAETAANERTRAAEEAARAAEAIQGREFALLSGPAKIADLQRQQAGLTKGSLEYREIQAEIEQLQERINAEAERAAAERQREARELLEAQRELMTGEQLLLSLRQELAQTLPEVERLKLLDRIADVERDITAERREQGESARDARLGEIEDRRLRREEEREAAAAWRVLGSSETSAEQKAAAADLLESIPLLREERAAEITREYEEAGGVSAGAADPRIHAALVRAGLADRRALEGIRVDRRADLALSHGSLRGAVYPGIIPTATPADAGSVMVQIIMDSGKIAEVVVPRASRQVVADLRGGQNATRLAGPALPGSSSRRIVN